MTPELRDALIIMGKNEYHVRKHLLNTKIAPRERGEVFAALDSMQMFTNLVFQGIILTKPEIAEEATRFFNQARSKRGIQPKP